MSNNNTLNDISQQKEILVNPFANQHHSFDIGLAAIYGIEEAILIHHFQFWIRFNKKKNINQHDGRTWMYQTIEDIALHFPYWSFDQVRNIVGRLCNGKDRHAENDKYEAPMLKGNYNKTPMDRTCWYAFKDEDTFLRNVYERVNTQQEKGKSPFPIEELPAAIPDPIPDPKRNIKGNEESMPFFKEKKKNSLELRKFKRPKEEQEVFDWLKTLELDTDENTLSFWAHSYSKKKLEDTYAHFLYQVKVNGLKPKSTGAIFRHFLEKECNPINSNCEVNRNIAINFAEVYNWTTLEIKDKYVEDCYFKGKDISLNMGHEEFTTSLESLFKSIKRK